MTLEKHLQNGLQKYPLEQLSLSDKILYVFYHLLKDGNTSTIILRHSQIVNNIQKFASEQTYNTYAKSTRTYYRKYKILLDRQYLDQVKETVTGNNYNAYEITDQGVEYIARKINLFLNPQNLAASINNKRKLIEIIEKENERKNLRIKQSQITSFDTISDQPDMDLITDDELMNEDYVVDQDDEDIITKSPIFKPSGQSKPKTVKIKPPPKKTPDLLLKIVLSQISMMQDLSNNATWIELLQKKLTTQEKLAFTVQIFEKIGLTAEIMEYLSDSFLLTEQDIADLINMLEKSTFSQHQLQIVADQLVVQIIQRMRSTGFVISDFITVDGEQLSYDSAIRIYLKNLFNSHLYDKILHVLGLLKDVTPHLDADFQLLEMKILLNQHNYPGLEKIIGMENILTRSWKDDSLIFLAFRTFYEQQKYDLIYDGFSHFPDKLKELARANYQILHDFDNILTPHKIHKIFTNLIPEFHTCPSDRASMIQFILEKLYTANSLNYYFFTIHFVYWLKNYEENDPRITEILEAWLMGAQQNPTTIGTYFTLKEEIITEILRLHPMGTQNFDTKALNQELHTIRSYRTQSKISNF